LEVEIHSLVRAVLFRGRTWNDTVVKDGWT